MQVISLTEELLATAKQSEIAGLVDELDADASPIEGQADRKSLSNLVITTLNHKMHTKKHCHWLMKSPHYSFNYKCFLKDMYHDSF